MERELLLLGVLRQGEMHGYQLHDFIERSLAFCTDLKKPTAYFLLDKMGSQRLGVGEGGARGQPPPAPRVSHDR